MVSVKFVGNTLPDHKKYMNDGDMALVYNNTTRKNDVVVMVDEEHEKGSGLFLSVVTGYCYLGEELSLIYRFKNLEMDCENLIAVLK